MKTSLVLDDLVFAEAKKEAQKTGKTISEVISKWAEIGRQHWKTTQKKSKKKFAPADLGGEAKISLVKRSKWLEELENDRD